MNNLYKRTIFGAVYILVMIGGTVFNPYIFAVVFAALLTCTLLEYYSMVNQAGHQPSRWLGTAAGLFYFLLSFGAASGLLHREIAYSIFPLLFFMMVVEIFSSKKHTLENSSLKILGLLYIAVPFSLMNFLLFLPSHGNLFYPWIVIGIYFIIWANDSFAYLLGTTFGRHKMCKNISPNKSWEGLIGGAIFATVMGLINAVLFPAISMFNWVMISALTITFGTLGDLFQSKIKREIGIKDSGNILPGHGGFLDRLDSLLFTVPAVFIWLVIAGVI